MRIGIDARFYGPTKQKGLGRYLQKLIQGLENCNSNNEFVIFLRQDNWNEYIPKKENFKKVLADYPWYSLKEQIFFPFKIKREKVDLMHFPHFNVPVFYSAPFVVTIHDLILKHFPTRKASTLGPVRYFIKNLGYNFVIKSALKRAGKIIAVSNYTKEDILKYFKIDSDKIEVIYEGAPQKREEKKKQENYLLYVGNAYPHKNLERLILAFEQLDYPDLKLVLVGQLDYFYQRLKTNINSQRIIFTDYVSDEQLAELYQNALIYIFPSLCEGFGLPPLEAMSYGLPVVSSSASCLPEILGKAALYFDPENVNDILEKIKQILDNQSLKKELISAGYQRIKEYDWQKTARQTLEIYGSLKRRD